MIISLTRADLESEIRRWILTDFGVRIAEITFVHHYPDGSGEADVDLITPIDRIDCRVKTVLEGAS
jgi:hypothetical protein